jgi:hypothetical protein
MQKPERQEDTEQGGRGHSLWLWSTALVCLILIFVTFLNRHAKEPPARNDHTGSTSQLGGGTWTATMHLPTRPRVSTPVDSRSPEEIVAEKVIQFARSRRTITHDMAKRFNVPVPPEVEGFYDAAETGRWEELKAAFESLRQSKQAAGEKAQQMNQVWGPIHETFGVAEVAHEWPAQKLLDYGQAVLGSLRPGMVYSGGTDAGRFIPTLLNATSGGDGNIVLTQNALADNSYREYVDFLYGDRMTTLSQTDSDRVFQQYIADAQNRLTHDQQFPNEPKQVRPGEDVRMTDGRVQVSGQVAVMAINERLFQQIMDKNPSLSFAMEESFPFKSTYANAAPLGPVMELNVPAEHPFSAQAADQSIDYWNGAVQDLLADPDAPAGSEPRKSWSKMIVSQAHLLADRDFGGQAEQAYKLAVKVAPESPEAVFGYVSLLLEKDRPADAAAVIANALNAAPDNENFRQLREQLKTMRKK